MIQFNINAKQKSEGSSILILSNTDVSLCELDVRTQLLNGRLLWDQLKSFIHGKDPTDCMPFRCWFNIYTIKCGRELTWVWHKYTTSEQELAPLQFRHQLKCLIYGSNLTACTTVRRQLNVDSIKYVRELTWAWR